MPTMGEGNGQPSPRQVSEARLMDRKALKWLTAAAALASAALIGLCLCASAPAFAALVLVAWAASGALGGHLLSYPGDGLNARHLLGGIVGPIALLLAMWERAFPD